MRIAPGSPASSARACRYASRPARVLVARCVRSLPVLYEGIAKNVWELLWARAGSAGPVDPVRRPADGRSHNLGRRGSRRRCRPGRKVLTGSDTGPRRVGETGYGSSVRSICPKSSGGDLCGPAGSRSGSGVQRGNEARLRGWKSLVICCLQVIGGGHPRSGQPWPRCARRRALARCRAAGSRACVRSVVSEPS